jgi:hypothetical protein
MLVQNLIDLINLEADELLDTDEDNIPYINAAMDAINFNMAAAGVPELVSEVIITDGMLVPSNFIDFIPKNGYPCRRLGNIFKTDIPSVTAVYACAIPRVSTVEDTIPLSDMFVSTITLIASYLIKKKSYIPTEYTAADYAYIQSLVAPIIKAKGGS